MKNFIKNALIKYYLLIPLCIGFCMWGLAIMTGSNFLAGIGSVIFDMLSYILAILLYRICTEELLPTGKISVFLYIATILLIFLIIGTLGNTIIKYFI